MKLAARWPSIVGWGIGESGMMRPSQHTEIAPSGLVNVGGPSETCALWGTNLLVYRGDCKIEALPGSRVFLRNKRLWPGR